MKEVIGLALLIVILLFLDRYFSRVEDRIDDHLRESPHRQSIAQMLRSMGAPQDLDLVEKLTNTRVRFWRRMPIWIMIAMLGIGLAIRLFEWVKV